MSEIVIKKSGDQFIASDGSGEALGDSPVEALDNLLDGRFKFPRPSLLAFARTMEGKLQDNDHKGGWDRDTISSLLVRVKEELQELEDAIMNGEHYSDVEKEAADVANFMMMVADVYTKRQGGRR